MLCEASAACQFFPRLKEQPCEVWSGPFQGRVLFKTRNTDTFKQVLGKTYPQYLSDLIILWIMQTSVNPVLRYPCRKLQEDVFPILHIAVSWAVLIISFGI